MNQSPIPAPKIILMGPSGTGKTHSIRTLVDAGITPFVIFTEPGMEVLSDIPKEKLHWKYIPAGAGSILELKDIADKVNKFSFEALTKMTDANRSKYNQFENFLRTLNDVKPDDGSASLGAVDSWGTDYALVIDGLTGLGLSVMKSVIGGKADIDQKDWGLAQNMLENVLRKITSDCRCHFILIAHVERETDMILGGSKISVSTLGKALPPKLPPMFSDVILTTRLGKEYYWDTENSTADVKSRNLPISSKNKPTFASIIDKWKSRGGVI